MLLAVLGLIPLIVTGCGGGGDDPVTTDSGTFVFGTVTSATGEVWMDRNLGASQVATSMTDSAAYGDLYQWGRNTDGHEKRDSETTTTNSDNPTDGRFILETNYPYDWRITPDDNLWQGVPGNNNPCPSGYRLPTETEWQTEMNSWNSLDSVAAWESPLKLVLAGYRDNGDGTLINVDNVGYYWSSMVSTIHGRELSIYSNVAGVGSSGRSFGHSVRCIRN